MTPADSIHATSLGAKKLTLLDAPLQSSSRTALERILKQLRMELAPLGATPVTAPRKPVVQPMAVARSTFKGGLNVPVHRWFRLTPSFGPELVDEMLERLEVNDDEWVLDPFAGASTTLIQCKKHRIRSGGFEINPLLNFVGQTCLDWTVHEVDIRDTLDSLHQQFLRAQRALRNKELEELGLEIPPIHNVERWWRRDVLKDLLILRDCIERLDAKSSVKNTFKLGLLAVLVPDLTNVTLGRLQLHFIDRSQHEINVMATFQRHMQNVAEDCALLEREYGGPQVESELIHGDSTVAAQYIKRKKFSAVITSPPYPNRYSYVWNTRPHLYFGNFFKTAKEASSLDLQTIGGTWGAATSVLQKGAIAPRNQIVANAVEPINKELSKEDPLMANYCMKYFNMLSQQVEALQAIGTEQLRIAYVVGCSRLKGIYIETDVLLGKIFEGYGFRSIDIVRFRKRNSGKDLHESVVYGWR